LKLLRTTFACLVLALGLAPPCASAEDPAAVVERLHAALLGSMQAGGSSVSERADSLRPVVLAAFDFETIARVVLGRAWGELAAAERSRFIEVFGELSVATYAARFKSFNGERFVTLGTDAGRRQGESLVRTHIERPASGKPPVSLQYLLKASADGSPRVVNVVADGVSDLSLKRTEYAAALKEGRFSDLIGRLEAKTSDLYAGRQAE